MSASHLSQHLLRLVVAGEVAMPWHFWVIAEACRRGFPIEVNKPYVTPDALMAPQMNAMIHWLVEQYPQEFELQ